MSIHKTALQDALLQAIYEQDSLITIYLVNGIRLIGKIERFDGDVIFLKNEITQIIYKHAIATLLLASEAHQTSKNNPEETISEWSSYPMSRAAERGYIDSISDRPKRT